MTVFRSITLANRGDATYRVDRRKPLLDSLRENGVDLPYGCKYGGCITCAAKLIAGEVNQKAQVALPPLITSTTIRPIIPAPIAMLSKCLAGSRIGAPDMLPFSFANAITEPVKVRAPMAEPSASSIRDAVASRCPRSN